MGTEDPRNGLKPGFRFCLQQSAFSPSASMNGKFSSDDTTTGFVDNGTTSTFDGTCQYDNSLIGRTDWTGRSDWTDFLLEEATSCENERRFFSRRFPRIGTE
ncbi:unnamed protein product [Nippostrongylus brasiliensis]|uniref:Uncharacterized protein n=1 Tax=Nippostrongylus brasiliensis TaxID=27835 RepID=A0A0N4YEM9_NIPBR|nr:unnamed protein product [Nippostrongylus brasiliensis]